MPTNKPETTTKNQHQTLKRTETKLLFITRDYDDETQLLARLKET